MIEILVLGTADWQQAIATNQQYVVRELAQSHRVTFVESMGLRRPELRLRDLRRISRRLFRRGTASATIHRPIPEGVTVIAPLVLPLHTWATRWINAILVRRAVRAWLTCADGTRLLWTYTPVTYGLEMKADATVYHCVDLLAEVDGIPGDLISRSESALAVECDAAIATSSAVAQHLRDVGYQRVEYWPNVADTAVIDSRRPTSSRRRTNSVVFAGNLTPTKVDFAILREVVAAGFELHLAGPVSEGGGKAPGELDALVRAGAIYHGHLSLEDLADQYWSAVVGLIPYVLNGYTRGVSPLKTYEYLAAGCAVVSTEIPDIEHSEPDIFVASGPQEFVEALRRAADLPTVATQERREALARGRSWTNRGEEARRLAAQLIC